MTVSGTVDENGISVPDYAAIFADKQDAARSIYGSDIYIDPDSQDGQLIGVYSLAESLTDALATAVYAAFSPASAQGTGLSSVVKINGLTRLAAAKSTVDVTLTGDIGTVIPAGAVADAAGNKWYLPANTTITPGTSITVTATAAEDGAITASPGSITKISTPVAGWASVTNASSATPGRAAETDPELRARQAISTALPAMTVLGSALAQIEQLSGVTRARYFENDTGATDSNGILAHSVGFVVEGGDATAVATVIANRKAPGCGTVGTTTVTVADANGISKTINFSRPTIDDIAANISITAGVGYTSTIGTNIKASVAAAINALGIGDDVLYTRLYVPAQLAGPYAVTVTTEDGQTFELTSLTIGLVGGGSPSAADIAVAYNHAAACDVADITLTVI